VVRGTPTRLLHGRLDLRRREAREIEQRLEDLPHAPPDSARDVVEPGRHGAIQKAEVGADDVLDVEEVAHRIQVADRDARRPPPERDLDDLAREARLHERVRSPAPGMVEGPDADDVEPARPMARREQIRRGLRARVRRAGTQRRRLVERRGRRSGHAVHVAGADREDARARRVLLHRPQDVPYAEEVHPERPRRVAKGIGNERARCQVDDCVGRCGRDRPGHGVRIADVDLAIDADRCMPRRHQPRNQPAADEPRRSRHENPHARKTPRTPKCARSNRLRLASPPLHPNLPAFPNCSHRNDRASGNLDTDRMPYQFLDFDLDPLRSQLTRRGEPVDVPRQIFELILLLIRHRDRPVPKEEILATIWHGRAVTDASLTHAIATARRLLGDSPKSQAAIKTMHKRGYWWVAETTETKSADHRQQSVPPMPFVGRSSELRVVRRAFDQSALGTPSLLIVTGEPGIGKTRFISECVREGRDRRFTVIEASCMEDDGAPPGFPWIGVMRQSLSKLSGATLDAPTQSAVQHLIATFPGMAESPHPRRPTPMSRYSLFESMWTLLSAVTQAAPAVVAIDDLHRADDLSLSALRFLARQMGSIRLVLLASARTGTSKESESAIAELARQPRSTSIHLDGLLRTDISILLEGVDLDSPSAVGDFLYDRSAGNPFFVLQLISALGAHRTERAGSYLEQTASLPATLREAVLKQIDGLDQDCRDVLSVASVLGRSFLPSIVSEVLDGDARPTLDALEDAERCGIVENDPSIQGGLRFRHLILRDAVYYELSRSRRAELHLQIGQHLAGRLGTEPAVVAHHLRSSYPLSDATQIGVVSLAAARKATERSSYLDATAECRASLDLAGPAMTASLRCKLLLEMAGAQLRAGNRSDGRLTLRSAASLARTAGLAKEIADVALAIAPGFFAIETGTVDPELIEALEEALSALPSEDSIVRVRLLRNLCSALYWSPYSHRNIELVAEAERMAQRLGRAESSAHALAAWYTGLWSPSNVQARRDRCHDLLDLADASGDHDLKLMSRVFRIAIFLEAADARRLQSELASYERLVAETLHPHGQWYVPMYRAMLSITRGEFNVAQAHMAEFVAKGSRFEDANVVQTFLLQSAESAWQCGRGREILHAVEENVARNPVLREWQCALAFLLAVIGSQSEAKSLCRQLVLEWREPHLSRMNAPIAFGALTEACWVLDDAELAGSLEEIAPPWEERVIVAGYGVLCWGSSARGMAHLAATQGRLDEAEVLYRLALKSEEMIGAVPWATRTKLALARALERRGGAQDSAAARALGEEALADAAKTGITLYGSGRT
jgi:DNA-binding winged helix-turn-helix (wHTH) protein